MFRLRKILIVSFSGFTLPHNPIEKLRIHQKRGFYTESTSDVVRKNTFTSRTRQGSDRKGFLRDTPKETGHIIHNRNRPSFPHTRPAVQENRSFENPSRPIGVHRKCVVCFRGFRGNESRCRRCKYMSDEGGICVFDSVLLGDWMCKRCNIYNYRHLSACAQCSRAKEQNT